MNQEVMLMIFGYDEHKHGERSIFEHMMMHWYTDFCITYAEKPMHMYRLNLQVPNHGKATVNSRSESVSQPQ